MEKKCRKLINEAIKYFPIMHQFCNGDLNKIVLSLRKGVYSYEDMNSWEEFDETSFLDKKAFYRELYLEDVTDKDYAHGQKVWEVSEVKTRGEYHICVFSVIHYCLQMCLKILEISVLKYMDLILLIFFQHQD